jgi:hypothetical protein
MASEAQQHRLAERELAMRRAILAIAATVALTFTAATPAFADRASTGKAVTMPISNCFTIPGEEIDPAFPDDDLTICETGTITVHFVATPTGGGTSTATGTITSTSTYQGTTETDQGTFRSQSVTQNGRDIEFHVRNADTYTLADGTTCSSTSFLVVTNDTARVERFEGDCPGF